MKNYELMTILSGLPAGDEVRLLSGDGIAYDLNRAELVYDDNDSTLIDLVAGDEV